MTSLKYFLAIFMPVIIGAGLGYYFSNYIYNFKRLFLLILLSVVIVFIGFSISNIIGIELLIGTYFFNFVSFKKLRDPKNNSKYPIEVNPEDFKHERETDGIPKELVEMRERNYCNLASYGFRSARWLPIQTDRKLRPVSEIASRLYALNILTMWVLPEDLLPTDMINKMIEVHKPKDWLTEDESAILALSREEAKEQNLDSIGWRFENMWPLAWILGFKIPPLFYVGQMPEEISTEMLMKFIPENKSPEHIVSNNTLRSEAEVIEMEDLFYCAHNAVRSAQMGSDTVPEYFHPISDGGAIHERRHALTWCVSPNVSWEDTDLST